MYAFFEVTFRGGQERPDKSGDWTATEKIFTFDRKYCIMECFVCTVPLILSDVQEA